MREPVQGADGGLDDPVARLIVETRDQAEAAGVPLVAGTVQAEIAGAHVDAQRLDARRIDARRVLRRIAPRDPTALNVLIRHNTRPQKAAPCVNAAEFCGKTITYKSIL